MEARKLNKRLDKVRSEFDEKEKALNEVKEINCLSSTAELLNRFQSGWYNLGYVGSGPQVTATLEEYQKVSESMMTAKFLRCEKWESDLKPVEVLLSRDGVTNDSLKKLRMLSGQQGACDFVADIGGKNLRNQLNGCPTQANIDEVRKLCEEEVMQYRGMNHK